MVDDTLVTADHIAREWRCKWSQDNDNASLVAAQAALDGVLGDVKATPGVVSVQRVVCGGCLDFKVIVKLDAASWGAFEEGGHGPEEKLIAELKAIDGIKVRCRTSQAAGRLSLVFFWTRGGADLFDNCDLSCAYIR